MFARHRFRLITWLACLAMTVAAIAPTISHALAALGGERMVMICTAAGIRFVDVSRTGQEDPVRPSGASGLHEACACCGTSAVAGALPIASQTWIDLSDRTHVRSLAPSAVDIAHDRSFAHLARGPPVFA